MKAVSAYVDPGSSWNGSRVETRRAMLGSWRAYVTVDTWPITRETPREEKIVDTLRTAYLAQREGAAQGFLHQRNNEHGFGGQPFTIELTSGETRTVKGPWSSGASAMSALYGVPLIDMAYKAEDQSLGVYSAGWVTSEWFDAEVMPLLPAFVLVTSPGRPWSMEASGEQSAIIDGGRRTGSYLELDIEPPYCKACDGFGWNYDPEKACKYHRTEEFCQSCDDTGWYKASCAGCDGRGIVLSEIPGAKKQVGQVSSRG